MKNPGREASHNRRRIKFTGAGYASTTNPEQVRNRNRIIKRFTLYDRHVYHIEQVHK